MKKHLIAIASIIVITCTPAFASAAASGDPAVVEATKQMMASMKIRDVMAASLRQAEQQMPAQLEASLTAAIDGNTRMSTQEKAAAHKRLEQALPALNARMRAVLGADMIDDVLAEMVPLYAEIYTLDEIRQLSAIYASPLGQKMLANMPKVMERMMEISNRLIMPRVQKLMAESAQEFGEE